MRLLAADFGLNRLFLGALIAFAGAAIGQNPPSSHVIIPNPTPRPPDLKQEYGDNPKDEKKRQALVIQNEIRAREVWLESNQILLLAQQVQDGVLSRKRSVPMSTNAAKVTQIEKLAQSMQQKMKVH